MDNINTHGFQKLTYDTTRIININLRTIKTNKYQLKQKYFTSIDSETKQTSDINTVNPSQVSNLH